MQTNTADTLSVDIKVPAEMPEFSEDLTYSPRMRVVRVGQSLKTWRVADQTFESDRATPEGIEQTVIGMLSDLRFLCDEHGLDFARIDRMAYGDYTVAKNEARREAAKQAESTAADNVPSASLKLQVLGMYSYAAVSSLDGYQYLAGFVRATAVSKGTGIFVVNGVLNRATYKKLLEEARAAQLQVDRVVVYGEIATYTGAGISFTKFDELPGLDRG
ncbi:hypothetical protein [Paraburkholderia aromaticivorans]|uniref:Uncharacterized protein n=1 Tax=Paraburkholderia aromaticivorans TaxID=2026199 RepID=A0A248VX79_9BURK|nr:hypothetical protein [Paraburkholderia aromaticivorans]ASW03646.1 hypothetical protein CJU94_36185 [Paraburkholderia aromaticivorans]